MADPVDAYVEAVVTARLSRADASELLIDHGRPEVDQLRDEAVALRSRLDTVAAAFADGAITAAQLRTVTGRVRARLAAVEAEMADAGKVDILGPLVSASDVEGVWASLSVAQRRAVIDTLCEVQIAPPGRGTRTFRPESVTITPRI